MLRIQIWQELGFTGLVSEGKEFILALRAVCKLKNVEQEAIWSTLTKRAPTIIKVSDTFHLVRFQMGEQIGWTKEVGMQMNRMELHV